jgi:hypothetical protein
VRLPAPEVPCAACHPFVVEQTQVNPADHHAAMKSTLQDIRPGLALVLLGLLFGTALGIWFGIDEASFKDYIARGIAAHPQLHDASSADKIWRYVQRAHFHATGIAAFSLGLLWLVVSTDLSARMKGVASLAVGLGSFYPLAWFTTFYLAPSLGRNAAHEHPLSVVLVYVSTGGLLVGIALVVANVFLRLAVDETQRGAAA